MPVVALLVRATAGGRLLASAAALDRYLVGNGKAYHCARLTVTRWVVLFVVDGVITRDDWLYQSVPEDKVHPRIGYQEEAQQRQ